MITLLRIMLVLTFCKLGIEFPWWLWLYGIIIELDHHGIQFLTYRAMSYQHKQITLMEAQEANVGGQPREPN